MRETDDTMSFDEVKEDKSIRDLIRKLEENIIGKKRLLSEINPNNPSVKKWIKEIMSEYPNRYDSKIEDLLNEYRSVLSSRSMEKEKFIIAILQLKDILIIVHCKKGPSLAEIEDKVVLVETILHQKNIVRADIIKKEEGIVKILSYEQSRKFSKGHAKFWGVEIEDIGWDFLGNICLNVELDGFDCDVQINVDNEKLKNMIDENRISSSGKIKIVNQEGTISKVYAHNKTFSYLEFYDFYVTETKKLDEYKRKFNSLIPSNQKDQKLSRYIGKDKWRYGEDTSRVFEIKGNEKETVIEKEHPRYSILFLTKCHPLIKPEKVLLNNISDAIFNNTTYDVYHAGDGASKEGFKIGNLRIYNDLKFCENFEDLSSDFINKIQDAESSKLKSILKVSFCYLMKKCIKSKHFNYVFDYLLDLLISDIKYEFKTEGLLFNEGAVEFKSAEEWSSKPTGFAKNKLVPTIRKYIEDKELSRICIIYGIEDDQTIKPIYNFKSDMASRIEQISNEELKENKVTVKVTQSGIKREIYCLFF